MGRVGDLKVNRCFGDVALYGYGSKVGIYSDGRVSKWEEPSSRLPDGARRHAG